MPLPGAVYTDITTAGGWQTNTVTTAYDLVFRKALNALPACRQFIDVQPENVSHVGSTDRIQKIAYFAAAAVTAAKTPLTEESDVSATQVPATTFVDLTPNEYGFAVARTDKLQVRSMVSLDASIPMLVADHCDKTLDELLQDQMVLGTQVFRAGQRASTVTVTATDVGQAVLARQAVTTLRTQQARPRDGQFFVGLIHPNVVHDIRQETGSGGWRVPSEYGTNQGQIWAGEFGEFEGVRWIQNARLRRLTDGAASAPVYRSFVLGKEALAQSVRVAPQIVIGPVVDNLRRFNVVGWKADLAFKIFRDEAIVRLETSSSMG